MYALLLIVGALVTAAGIALVGTGVSIQEHSFDPATITPGAVGVVGGLILIGIGLVLRELARIERALVQRPMERAVQVDEAAGKAAAPDLAAAAVTPLPLKPATEPQPQSAPAEIAAAPKLPEDAAVDRLREQFSSLVRAENTPVVEEADVSLLPKTPLRADEESVEVSRSTNNVVPVRPAPRLEVAARGPVRRDRPGNFDTFWPKRQRPGQQATAAQVALALPIEPTPAVEPSKSDQPAAQAQPPAEAVTPVSILKSGVVDGMAYTLFSDGSIEAQLPQGTLRFGSITELRNHIEQSA